MIKVNVLCEDYSWTKRIKKKQDLFNQVCKKFPKKYRFISKKAYLTLLLSNNNKIKILNKKFRNKNKHTDILSFPFKDKKKKLKEIYLGDLIISYNYMSKPKNLSNYEFKKKTIKIFIHGFLHLLGYDHIKNKEYKEMLKQEQKVFKSVEKLLN
jgi:probable rRNA maturation factor